MTEATADQPLIRPYRPGDRADCFDICVRTANLGDDARPLYSSESLMGDLFFAPYVDLDPGLAFVVDAGDAVVGYVVATANTRRFVEEYRARLLPAFARRYPFVDPASGQEAFMISLGHEPERLLLPQVDEYPAHIHIDLLPDYQRRGFGRRLIDTERAALAARGVPALHLSMVKANRRARAFYDRVGFVELDADDELETLGIATAL